MKRVRGAVALLPLLHAVPLLLFLWARHAALGPDAPLAPDLPVPVPERLWSAGTGVLALANEFVPFFFLPLPLWLLTAAVSRTRVGALVSAVPWLLFLGLYGELFAPREAHLRRLVAPVPLMERALQRVTGQPATPPVDVRVMSVNVLYANGVPETLAAFVLREAPDIVFVQELSPDVATALDRAIAPHYPHRDLRPHPGPEGGGVWSRHPLRVEETWGGAPDVTRHSLRWQHLSADVSGRRVELVNLHLTPPGIHLGVVPRFPVPVYAAQFNAHREREVEAFVPALRTLAQAPLVVAGDLNLTDQTPEYHRLRGVGLRDAHREAGWGLGLTFPARPKLFALGVPLPVPSLIRIDYVLHSSHFATRRTWVPQEETGSDHRPVIADLRLRAAP